jgi:hypothetical protein
MEAEQHQSDLARMTLQIFGRHTSLHTTCCTISALLLCVSWRLAPKSFLFFCSDSIPSMSSKERYCTCPHLSKDLISNALNLCHSKRHRKSLWSCVHCDSQYSDYGSVKIHFAKENDHFLFVFHRSTRSELYCALCGDFQYSSYFDEFTSFFPQQLKTQRVIGFVNMGSTCFLSSVLQVLLSNPILIRFFDLSELFLHRCKALTSSQPRQLCLFCELSKLFKIVNKFTWSASLS